MHSHLSAGCARGGAYNGDRVCRTRLAWLPQSAVRTLHPLDPYVEETFHVDKIESPDDLPVSSLTILRRVFG